MALVKDTNATLEELREAVPLLEGADRTAQRVLGRDHPKSANIRKLLGVSRYMIERRTLDRTDPEATAAFLAKARALTLDLKPKGSWDLPD